MKLLRPIKYYCNKKLLLLLTGLGLYLSGMAQAPFTYRYTNHQKEEGYSMQLQEDKIVVLCGYKWSSSPFFSYPSLFTINYQQNLLNEDTLKFMDGFVIYPVDESFLLDEDKIAYPLDGSLFNNDTSGYYPNDAIAVFNETGFSDTVISLAWLWQSDSLYTKGIKKISDSSLITIVNKHQQNLSYLIELDFNGRELRRCFIGPNNLYAFNVLSNGDIFLWWFENGNSNIQLINGNCEVQWTRVLHNSIPCIGGVEGNAVENITEDAEGNIYLARTVDSLGVPGHGFPRSVILKLDRADGSCIWERGLSPAHWRALTIGILYQEEDNAILFSNTYDYRFDTSRIVVEEITLGLGKLNASTGAVIWYREIDVPELKSIGYMAFPRELKMHGDNIALLSTVTYDTRDSAGYLIRIDRDPMLFYLTCDGFDSLPQAVFTSSSAADRELLFKNTSSHSSTFYWDFGDGSYSTDTFPRHQYASEGYYTVQLIVNSCEYADTISQEVYASNIGLEEAQPTEELLLYPNPVQHTLHIAYQGHQQGTEYTIELYNNLGIAVYRSAVHHEVHSIDMSHFSSGIYHLKYRHPDGTYESKKVMKYE